MEFDGLGGHVESFAGARFVARGLECRARAPRRASMNAPDAGCVIA
jgi:hypothetical protein